MKKAKHTVYVDDISEVVDTSFHAYQRFKRRSVTRNRSLDAFKETIKRAEYVPSENVEGRVLVDHRT